MRLHRVGFLAVGFVVLMGLTGPAASAQQQQSDVQMEAAVTHIPDELPGVYEVAMEVTTSNSGGACLCTQTSVELAVVETGQADKVVISPASYTIHWWDQWQQAHNGGEHHKAVRVNVEVPELSADERMTKVKIAGAAHTDGPATHAEVHPIELALPVPQDVSQAEAEQTDAEASEADGSADEPTDGQASVPTEASTNSADLAEASPGLDGTAIGTGAGLATLSLAGLAIRRVAT